MSPFSDARITFEDGSTAVAEATSLRSNPLENPQIPISDPRVLQLFGYDVPQYAGRTFTAEQAQQISAVFCATNVLSEGIGVLPAHVYENGTRGKTKLPDHHVQRLLGSEPGVDLTPIVFKEIGTAHAALAGNFVAVIRWDGRGVPIELEPVHPSRAHIRRDGAKRVYEITLEDGTVRPYPSEDILHVHGRGWDGKGGLGVIRLAQRSMGLTVNAEEMGERFYANGARPSGFITSPGTLTPDQITELRRELDSKYTGTANSGRPMLLGGGMEWHQLTIPPDEAQFIETRKFQIADIARWFRIPPHMIGDLERATFSNIEHQAIDFVRYSLMPWILRWEQEINRKLFVGRRQYVKFSVEGLLRGDAKARGEWYRALFGVAGISPNEIREFEDMNPYDGGDRFYAQGGFVPVDMLDQFHAGKSRTAPAEDKQDAA